MPWPIITCRTSILKTETLPEDFATRVRQLLHGSPDGSLLAHGQCRFADNADIVTSCIRVRCAAPGEALGRPVCELTRLLGPSPTAVAQEDGPEGKCGMLYSVAFSPDGAFAATSSGLQEGRTIVGGEVTLWETRTWRLAWTIPIADYMVKSVAFAPDGRTLAGGCSRFEPQQVDGQYIGIASEIRLWETASGAPAGSLANEESDATIQRILFSPDGRQIVVYRYREVNQKEAQIWDLASGKCLQSFAGTGHVQGVVAFAPDCHTLASAGSDTSLHIWRIGA